MRIDRLIPFAAKRSGGVSGIATSRPSTCFVLLLLQPCRSSSPVAGWNGLAALALLWSPPLRGQPLHWLRIRARRKAVESLPFNASGLLAGIADPNLPDGEPGKCLSFTSCRGSRSPPVGFVMNSGSVAPTGDSFRSLVVVLGQHIGRLAHDRSDGLTDLGGHHVGVCVGNHMVAVDCDQLGTRQCLRQSPHMVDIDELIAEPRRSPRAPGSVARSHRPSATCR